MDKLERLQHWLHSQTSAFQHKLDKTKQIIDEAIQKVGEHAYIAYSSGIDSETVLDLLYSAGYRLPILWGDDAWDYPESLAFLRETEQRYDFYLQRIRCMDPWRDWCLEMSRPDLAEDPAALEVWGNPNEWTDTWRSLTKDAPLHGYTGVFLGLLASESRSRGYALRNGSKPLYQVKSEQGMWHCSPLAAWTKSDVWAYTVMHDLQYNPVYDKLAELGVPLDKRRVAPLTCHRVLQFGSHGHALKSGWPELHNKLCAVFPRVRSY